MDTFLFNLLMKFIIEQFSFIPKYRKIDNKIVINTIGFIKQ